MSIASDKIDRAVLSLFLDHPFFSSLIASLPRVEVPGIGTACTNGLVIKYDPEFIESLSPTEVCGLLVHEVLHPALGHLWRLPHNEEGNICADYAINNFLDDYNKSVTAEKSTGKIEPKVKLDLPEGGCLDHKYDGMSAEEIYAARNKEQPDHPEPHPAPQSEPEPDKGEDTPESNNGGSPDESEGDNPSDDKGNDKPSDQEGEGEGTGEGRPSEADKPGKSKIRSRAEGGWGEFEAPATPEDAEGEPQDMAKEWERRVVQAATAAKMQGTLPDCIEQLVDKLVNTKIPWQQMLERFVDETSAEDYSWRKPDRRFIGDDIVIPDLQDETLGEIVIAVDTSGSIFCNPEALASFEAEVNAVVQKCAPKKTTVLYCDAAIAHVEEYEPGTQIKLTARGGGGTDFCPVGNYIDEHDIRPRVCIYLTDLLGTFPDSPWDFPTVWCVYDNPNGTAPFGDTVHIPKD